MPFGSIKVAVQNGLILIRDSKARDIPGSVAQRHVASTPSCVAVTCQPDSEGETEIIFDQKVHRRRDLRLVFEGRLETPSRCIIVESVNGELMSKYVADASANLRIWTDGHPATEVIAIELET